MAKKLNSLVRFALWLTNTPLERDVVHSVEVAANNKKMAEKIASQEAQLARNTAEKREQKERENDKSREQKVARKLTEEEKQLDKNYFGDSFSLNKFYKQLFTNKKFRDSFEIADKDDTTSWKFGEILFTTNGFMIITDKQGNKRAISRLPSGFIYKPGSILNQMKRKRLLLGVDKHGEYIPEIDDLEMPVPVWNDKLQQYEDSEEWRLKARDIIIEKDKEIRYLRDEKQKNEMVVTSYKDDLRDAKRKITNYEIKVRIADSDVSKANTDKNEMLRITSNLHGEIVSLREQVSLKERQKNDAENVIDTIMEKLEKARGMTAKEKALAEIKDAVNFYQTNIKPKEVIVKSPVLGARA